MVRNVKSIMTPEICEEMKPLRDKGVIWRIIVKAYPGLSRKTAACYYGRYVRGLVKKKVAVRKPFVHDKRFSFLQQAW